MKFYNNHVQLFRTLISQQFVHDQIGIYPFLCKEWIKIDDIRVWIKL